VNVFKGTARPPLIRSLRDLFAAGLIPSLLYFIGVALTTTSLAILGAIGNYRAVGVLLMLITARILNMVVLKRRTKGMEGCTRARRQGRSTRLAQPRLLGANEGMVDDLIYCHRWAVVTGSNNH
jgi:hypothetical protein